MSRSESKRGKITGRSGTSPQRLTIPYWIIKSPHFAALTGSELKLLLDLAVQFNGYNNGNFAIEHVRNRWRSRTTTQAARDGLVKKGWIVRTRHGGLRMGPDLYAVTWWPVMDCRGKHPHPIESVPSQLWAKTERPDQKLELVVPETGTSVGKKVAISANSVPETGTVEANLKAA